MDRVKTLFKYALWIILFWILSDILIYLGINSTYKDIENRKKICSNVVYIYIYFIFINLLLNL